MKDYGWIESAAAQYDAQLERDAQCHYGDHEYNGATCNNCGYFNGALLRWFAYEKAEKEGRAHYGHYHKTIERKQQCKRGPDADWVEAYGSAETTLE